MIVKVTTEPIKEGRKFLLILNMSLSVIASGENCESIDLSILLEILLQVLKDDFKRILLINFFNFLVSTLNSEA